MTNEEAAKIINRFFSCVTLPRCGGKQRLKEAFDTAFEALAKMEAIQDVIDMPFEWEQDDRRRYARVVNIVKRDLLQDCCAGSYCPDCGAKM
jgi:hypothetical protein